MVQLKTGGAYGVIEGLDGKKAIVFLEAEPFAGHITLSAGDKTMVLQGEGELTFEISLEEATETIELTAIDESGEPLGFTTQGGVEYEKITLDVELVTESVAENVPELIFENGAVGRYSLPRKVYGDGGGALIVKSQSGTQVLIGDYLFNGEAFNVDEETLFYECERGEGDILWPIKASYRMFYLGARVRLAHGAASKETVKGARHIDQVMIDVTGMLMGFPYERGIQLPNQVVVKKSGGVVAMKDLDTVSIREKLFSGDDIALSEMANVSFLGAPGASTFEVQLTSGQHMVTDLVEVNGYDENSDMPRLLAYKEGGDYVVKVVGHIGRAAMTMEDINDPTVNMIKVVDMNEADSTFRISDSVASQGMQVRVAVEGGSGWSPVGQIGLLDVSSTYAFAPQGIDVQAKPNSAVISYAIPRDVRFAGTRLYHEGKLVRDMATGTSVTITALTPETSYVFELAHYDVDDFESEHVNVSVQTPKEVVAPEMEPIDLYFDNVRMTYKI